jgi:hypothetical protein
MVEPGVQRRRLPVAFDLLEFVKSLVKGVISIRMAALLAVAVGAVIGGLAVVSAEVRADVEARALVKQLGADHFAVREAASKRLRELGVKALPAIKAGMADPDPEVARRSAAIRAGIT